MSKEETRFRGVIAGEQATVGILTKVFAEQKKIIYPLITIIVLWQILTLFFPPYLIPSVPTIAGELGKIITDRSLMISYLFTIYRALLALAASFLVGTVLSILMSYTPRTRDFVLTILHFMMGVPALSWVVIAVIWFAHVEFRIFYIVFITSLPMFALQVDDGIRAVNKDHIEMMMLFRPNRRQFLFKLILPSILPLIFTSWKINLGYGTRVVIVAELVGATVGVGNELLTAQELFRMEAAIAWTLMLVLFMLVTEQIIIQIENYVLRYRPDKALG
ncbi:MAG: ABC transporter permease subunit [Deltaproteobacteria bacterium]|nr:ABC transporter permease subunit [Deltaproteobacteria bacterium]